MPARSPPSQYPSLDRPNLRRNPNPRSLPPEPTHPELQPEPPAANPEPAVDAGSRGRSRRCTSTASSARARSCRRPTTTSGVVARQPRAVRGRASTSRARSPIACASASSCSPATSAVRDDPRRASTGRSSTTTGARGSGCAPVTSRCRSASTTSTSTSTRRGRDPVAAERVPGPQSRDRCSRRPGSGSTAPFHCSRPASSTTRRYARHADVPTASAQTPTAAGSTRSTAYVTGGQLLLASAARRPPRRREPAARRLDRHISISTPSLPAADRARARAAELRRQARDLAIRPSHAVDRLGRVHARRLDVRGGVQPVVTRTNVDLPPIGPTTASLRRALLRARGVPAVAGSMSRLLLLGRFDADANDRDGTDKTQVPQRSSRGSATPRRRCATTSTISGCGRSRPLHRRRRVILERTYLNPERYWGLFLLKTTVTF